MASLEHFDLCIGESLERLQSAVAEVQELKSEVKDSKAIVAKIASAILEIWKAREIFYESMPQVKRDFKRENEEDERRYEELNAILNRPTSLRKTVISAKLRRFTTSFYKFRNTVFLSSRRRRDYIVAAL